MEMVAAAKLRRSPGARHGGAPYSIQITEMLDNLAGGSRSELEHPLFKWRVKKTAWC